MATRNSRAFSSRPSSFVGSMQAQQEPVIPSLSKGVKLHAVPGQACVNKRVHSLASQGEPAARMLLVDLV